MTLYTPAVRDLSAATNADLLELCSLQFVDGSVIDLTGGSLAMQVRDKPAGTVYLDLSSGSTTANGSGVIITDAAAGTFTIDVKKADFAALSFGADTAIAGVYDLVFTNSSGSAIVLVRGRFTITVGVTA